MKTKSLSVLIVIAIAGAVGFRLYRKYDRERVQAEQQKANRELSQKVMQQQRENQVKLQQAAEQAKRDSLYAIQKKEREAQMKELQENLKKVEAELEQ